jgi:outer membrane protein TolC
LFQADIDEALSTREDLKATESRIRGAGQEILFSKANLLPTVSLGANYQYSNPNPRIFPNAATWKGIWDVGATVSYNLSNLYKTPFDISASKAYQESLSSQNEAAKEQIQIQLKQQMLAYKREQEKVAVSKQAVAQASENYRVTQNKYNGGIVILTDLLDANVLLLQAQINYENAKADQDSAWYELQHSLGKLNQ